jgi:homoserine kinase type II
MGVYSNIELEQINKILDYYHIGRALSFEPTIEGISNSNFKVELDNSKTVLLKISNDKTIEQLENEQTILSTLQQYNYDYSLAPLPTIKGLPIYQHENFYGVVFPYIKGLPPKIDNNVLVQIGCALGKLHSLEIRKEHLAKIRPHDLVGYGGVSISNYVENMDSPKDFRETFLEIFPNKLKDIPYELFPAGIIHGDLYFDNSLFNQGKLVTLIDFEQSGRGRFLLDLGIAISGSCLGTDHLNLDRSYIQSFLDGYEQTRKLLTIEKEYLNSAILVGFFSIGLWRIKRFYEGQLDSRKKHNYRELLERAQLFHRACIKLS